MELTDKQKAWPVGALAALSGLVLSLKACIEDPAPVVGPSPSPSSVVMPSPTPSPSVVVAPSSVPAGAKAIMAARGETVDFLLQPAGAGISCAVPAGMPVAVECLEVQTVNVPTASWIGGPTGAVEDPLVPIAARSTSRPTWVDMTVSKNAIPGTYSGVIAGQVVVLTVVPFTIPDRNSFPFYIEVESRKIYFAHGLGEASITQAHSDMVKKYHALMRAHRIEPMKQAMSGLYPVLKADKSLDLDYLSAVGASHRQLFLTGNIAPPVLWGPANAVPPSVDLLKAVEAALKSGVLPADTMVYAWDEGWRTLDAQTLARVQLIKANAPSLKVFVTRFDESQFRPYVDFFVPNADAFQRPGWPSEVVKPYGLYLSCMSQGKCASGAPVARTGTPLHLVGASPDLRAEAHIFSKLGAQFGLYFNSTQMLETAWTNQENEGGFGDGTLLYPGVVGQHGVTAAGPVASLRLKYLRRGLLDMELIKAARAKGATITVPGLVDAFTWPKDHAVYDAARVQALNALNQ